MRPPGRRHARQLAHCRLQVGHVLQYRHAERRIEAGVGERQVERIRRCHIQPDIVRGSGLRGLPGVVDFAIDREQRHLRDVQSAEHHFGRPFAAPDIEDARAGARTERLAEELGKVAVPPAIAQVLEGRGREGVHVSGHQDLLVRSRHPRRSGHARPDGRAPVCRSIGECAAGLYLPPPIAWTPHTRTTRLTIVSVHVRAIRAGLACA